MSLTLLRYCIPHLSIALILVLGAHVALLPARCIGAEPSQVTGLGDAYTFEQPRIASPYDAGDRAQLFIDRIVVRDSPGVSFTQHAGKKHASNPLVQAELPWEGWRLEIFGSVLYDEDEKCWKMWYIGESPEDFPDYATLYAVSEDGVNWEKPILDAVSSRRGAKTNAVAEGYILASVIKDKSDSDPQRRYKMICWKQKPPYGAHLMTSPDGIHWKQTSEQPICPSADVVTGFYDDARGLYAAFPKINATVNGFDRRCFGLITSKDFATWSQPQLVLTPDARDDASSMARIEKVRPILDRPDDPSLMRTEFYGMGFYLAESCTIAFPWVLTVNANNRYGTNQEGPVEIQMAVSRDLHRWERPFRTPIIDIGELDRWDASCHMTSAQAVRFGDEIRLYYSGGNYTHGTPVLFHVNDPDTGEPTGRMTRYSSGIGMVSWGLDRFVSADAGKEGATLTTVPLHYDGKLLELNARTKPGGQITIEMLDAAGKPLPGTEASKPFSGDEIRHVVEWQSDDCVTPNRGKPVALRFHMNDAELFSFAFRDAPSGQ